MVNFSLRAFVAFFIFLSVSSVYAQNKVVVIPMAGGDLRAVYEIGKTGPAGGIVFHVTDGGLHGLEASHEDQSANAEWGCSDVDLLGIQNTPSADTPDPNTGAHNTEQIIATECGTPSAALDASSYKGPNGITTGWYLPNKEELDLLYNQRGVVGGFDGSGYWSSSEFSGAGAWSQCFCTNPLQGGPPKSDQLSVRAVRAF